MSKKTTIILIIFSIAFFILGAVLLTENIWYLGATSLLLTVLILTVVIGTHLLVAIEKLKEEEQMYRDKTDKLYEFMEWYKNEKGGAE